MGHSPGGRSDGVNWVPQVVQMNAGMATIIRESAATGKNRRLLPTNMMQLNVVGAGRADAV